MGLASRARLADLEDRPQRSNSISANNPARITAPAWFSTTSSTRTPGSPNSTYARPIPSLIVSGRFQAAAVEQPQRWSDP
jgi:hypothetical protein